MKQNKFIGSILIVIGTSIGAGILALPLVSAPIGWVLSIVLLVTIWGLMSVTGLLVLEVNLALDPRAGSFGSMAKETLGRSGQIIAWLSCLLLLYALTAAYIAGASSLLGEFFRHYFDLNLPNFVNALLFVSVLGGAVFWSTKATDFLNRGLISVKGFLLFAAVIFLMPHVDFVALVANHNAASVKYLFAALPIFICSFGYHTVIPSIRIYIGDKPKELRNIILIGTLASLLIYIVWVFVVLNIVPLDGTNSFTQIFNDKSSVGGMIKYLIGIANSKLVAISINGFSNFAMTTSFLGVTLGLFDFVADGFKRSNDRLGRLQTAFLTFIPPLIFALYFPEGFILALNYAAIFVIVLEIILPAVMVYRLRYIKNTQQIYRTFGGKGFLMLIALIGFALIGLQVLLTLRFLPNMA